jgi:lauroyl/myristoyl acyltransferase
MRLEDIPIETTRAPEPPGPPLSALWSGGAKGWLQHHVTDRIEGWAQIALYQAMRPLPPEIPAAVGRLIGPIAGHIDRKRPYVEYMRRGLRLIRPDLGDTERAALLASWWRHSGTTHAQYPVLDRMAVPGRLTIHNPERLAAVDADGPPTFFLLVHLANFEMFTNVAQQHIRRPGFAVYSPQPNRYQNRLIYWRRKAKGLYAFPPSRLLPRTLLPLVRGGACGVFFIDEVSEGRCKFPLWGGPVPEHSNLIFALKLAHATGARLQPCHFLRTAPGRVGFHLLDPIEPGGPADRDTWVRQRARQLSAMFEPPIAAHPDQWYMLKDMRR